MAKAQKQNIVLVYDLRRDRSHQDRVLPQVQERWQVYERGD